MKRSNKKPSKNAVKAKSQSMISATRHNVDLRVDFGSPTQGITRMQTAPTPRIKKK